MNEMSVRKTYKEKLRPTPEQERQLAAVLWRCRTLYNVALEQRLTWWRRGQGRSVTRFQQEAELKDLRAAFPECHFVARENRPRQQTFWWLVCGHTTHADGNAAENLASRLGDQELLVCADRAAVKVLLARRHQNWLQNQRLAVVQPPA